MVLKLCRNKKYDDVLEEEITYKGSIKDVECHYPLNDNNCYQSMRIFYDNGQEDIFVIGEYNKEKDIYEPIYKYVFLMNEEGKTIEKII